MARHPVLLYSLSFRRKIFWQRLGALLSRLLRGLLRAAPHRLWLHVDDLLVLLRKARVKEDALSVGRANLLAQGTARRQHDLVWLDIQLRL